MFQEMLAMSSGGGGGGSKAFVQNYPNGLSDGAEIDVGFEPSVVYLVVPNYSTYALYAIWEKDVNSGQMLQVYTTSSWYTLPNTTYSGFRNISGTKITIQGNMIGKNCYLYAFGE